MPEEHTSPTERLPGQAEALYQENAQRVYYLALRMLGNPAKAEDATHDIFLRVFQKQNQFRGEAAVRTWIYRIAINHCQTLLGSWHHRNILNESETLTPERSGADDPLRVLQAKELSQNIQSTLDELPEEYRLLLLLLADEELSYQEIAELTSQSPDAVRGKLHRARKAFAERFRRFN